MAIAVDMWTWHDDQLWQTQVHDHPEINATGESQQQSKDLLVGAYNTANNTALTEADFTFTKLDEAPE